MQTLSGECKTDRHVDRRRAGRIPLTAELKPPADRIAIAEMERILQFWEAARIYDLRKLDVRLLGSAISALNVLRDAWGQWSYNPREQRVLFQNPAIEARFMEEIQLVQAIAIEVDAIREQLDSAMRPDQ